MLLVATAIRQEDPLQVQSAWHKKKQEVQVSIQLHRLFNEAIVRRILPVVTTESAEKRVAAKKKG